MRKFQYPRYEDYDTLEEYQEACTLFWAKMAEYEDVYVEKKQEEYHNK